MTPAEPTPLSDLTPLPTFHGGTYADHVKAWRLAHATREDQQWRLAAIAASLARSVGGSPRRLAARQRTRIQQFCRDVGIDRQTFYRLTHTYKTFAGTGNTSVTSFIAELPFKTFEVASRLAKDPAAAIIEAHEKRWSANELQRRLAPRPDPTPFSWSEEVAEMRKILVKKVKSWPEEKRSAELVQKFWHDVGKGVFDDFDTLVPVTLTPQVQHALRWIKADLENFPFTPRTYNEIRVGRGSSLEVVGGAAGAPIYHEIVGTSGATRQEILKAVDNVLAGKVTALGRRALDVARAIGHGGLTRLMVLLPDAGGDPTCYPWSAPPPFEDDLPSCLRELNASDDDDPIGRREEEAMAK